MTSSKTYSVGTLTYTRFGLLSVFFWMLWGDLCVNFMENVIPQLLPLQLKGFGASAATIGLVSASVPAGVELLIINPFISTYSDRFRSKWGRRRPFIIVCTPVLAVCLVMVGCAPMLSKWLGGNTELTIALLGVLLAVFQFFNVVVLATYYYMIADVIPQQVIGKFTSLFKIFGAIGGILFSKFVFPHSEGNELQIYIGAAALYLLAFLLMCWNVKEGEYPAPPPPLSKNGDVIDAVKQWLIESFTIRFYQRLYLIGLFYWTAVGSVLFQTFFALNDLKMSREALGDARFWAGVASLPVFFIMGPIADRVHPLRSGIVGMALMGVSSLASYFLIHDAHSFKVWTIINSITATVWLGSQISLLPRLFPRAQYGQYCSANNTLCALGKFGAPWLSGVVIGMLRNDNRLNYLWTAAFAGAGVVAVIAVYTHWKHLGGDLGYRPPTLEDSGAKAVGVEVITTPDRPENLHR